MPGSIKRKLQRAGGGCSWRNGGKSMRGGGAHHNHPKGRGRRIRKSSRNRINQKRKGVIVTDENLHLKRR